MFKSVTGLALALVIGATGSAALADGHGGKTGVNAFRACYGTATNGHVVGAPSLNLQMVVDNMPDKKAMGTGTVTWASVGPNFKPIKTEVKGPWYFMCTMKSCSVRWDFKSAPGAPGLEGSLVAPNWGAPGTARYEFKGGPGTVVQPMAVCN
ncbi:DUF1842 domain-containing protein [Magnetovibrio sp. PR-2]|uniref:DUF1842 domain-containing protein n=1 Tax=Magnetovibrio sp. PR-2 TaxID=3120356 RepID=UPI002FCE2D3B